MSNARRDEAPSAFVCSLQRREGAGELRDAGGFGKEICEFGGMNPAGPGALRRRLGNTLVDKVAGS